MLWRAGMQRCRPPPGIRLGAAIPLFLPRSGNNKAV
jgi:hypothetical protein